MTDRPEGLSADERMRLRVALQKSEEAGEPAATVLTADLRATLDAARDPRPVGEGLDVERLARAWLNAMTDGEHNAGCLDQGAMDCPVAAEVREFAPKVAAEYRRLADAGPVGDRDQFRLSMRHIVAANAILDRPSADPDDDAALVARAVLRLADPDLLSTDQPASTEVGEDG